MPDTPTTNQPKHPMKKPKITENFYPNIGRHGLKLQEKCGVVGTCNWYVADDEEAAANEKFYGAAQKMAEALEKILAIRKDAWDGCECIKIAEGVLLEAGYTEEDKS